MATRKICKAKGCKYADVRCDHPWWFDRMVAGVRWRMPVDDFAIPRGAEKPITAKKEAAAWEPKFMAEIKAGHHPRKPPQPKNPAAASLTVAGLLDLYEKQYVEPEGLRSIDTIKGRLKTLRLHLGHLPATEMEKPDAFCRSRRNTARSGISPRSIAS